MAKRSLCTDKEYWDHLDKDEAKDRALRMRLTTLATGRLCKKALAQVFFQARKSSSPDTACGHVLFLDLDDLKKKEKKSFIKVYNLAKAWFDNQVHDKLLNHYGFHQNAKVIAEIKRLAGEAGTTRLTEYHEVVTSNPEKEYNLDGTD